MSEKAFFVVVYDISDDKRRTRLHDRLLDYGSPVQYSVFECQLAEKDVGRMKTMIRRTIRPRLDEVRIYRLCQACLAKVWVSAASQQVLAETESVVV